MKTKSIQISTVTTVHFPHEIKMTSEDILEMTVDLYEENGMWKSKVKEAFLNGEPIEVIQDPK